MAGVHGEFHQIEVPLEAVRYAQMCLSKQDLNQPTAFMQFREVVTRSAQARNYFIQIYRQRTGKAKHEPTKLWEAPVPHPEVARLMHELRVDDFHSEPFMVCSLVQSTYGMMIDGELCPIVLSPTTFTATLASALFTDKPSRVGLYANGTTGEQDGDLLPLLSETREYVLRSSSSRIVKLIEEAGTDSIPELARMQHKSLQEYRVWFDGSYPELL